MSTSPLVVCTLVLPELVELHRARVNLRQAHESIQASSLQAKPAILGSIDQADDFLVEILRKSSKRAIRFLALGKAKRLRTPQLLIETLVELAPEEAAKWYEKQNQEAEAADNVIPITRAKQEGE